MEMEKGSASTSGTVTMEIPIAAAAAAASVERAELEECVQHHGQHRTGAAVTSQQTRKYRMLIVIGEISTSHHLDAARKQITQGEATEEGGQVTCCCCRGTTGEVVSLQLETSRCSDNLLLNSI